MKEQILKIGLPAGSLADPKRGGNLIRLLEVAGFKTSGYEYGGPSKFSTVNYLFGWDGRPQEFGSQLGINELDVAIAGDDWIYERKLELQLEYNKNIELEKILSLRRGYVEIVGIVNNDNEHNTIEDFLRMLCNQRKTISIVSEMPYIALNWLQENLKKIGEYRKFSNFSVQKYKTPNKIDQGIIVYETWGKTEAKVKNMGADIGVEITQTGSAIKNYGLKVIDTVMKSETGIWINPQLRSDIEKYDLLKMFVLNLYGVVNAENKVMILFNVSNNDVKNIEQYLRENNLFADEPTVNVGKTFTEFSIQVDITDPDIPLAKIRYELAKRKAVNINTIPVDSSIQNLDILGF
jgi:ATP phosphoribosyltransferase